MSELSDMIKNWNTDILKDEDRVYDSKDDINRLIKVIPLLGEGIIQMKTSTRNLMINGLPLDGKLYKGTGSDTSGIVEVVPEGTDYVYHMAKSGTTQGAWSIKSTDTTSISQIPYVSEDVLFTNTLIKGSGTATLQFLDKDGNVLSEMTTPALTDTYQAFNVKGQLKDSVWSFKIVASDAIYFKQVMITRSSFPSDYMLSEEELEQLNIINTSNIDANTVTKSHAYQVIGLKNCPANVSTSGLFITIQKDNFAQVFVPNDDTGIYYRVGVTTNRPNTKWTRLATSDNTYSKDDFTEMRTSDNINLIQDSSMSAGFWAFTKDGASTSVGSMDTADGIAHITGNGTSGTSWAQYQVTNQDYQQPLFQNSEIQYDQDYTVSVETTWSDGADIASNGEVPPSLIVREDYKDGSSKDIVHVKAVDKYGYNKWHKLSGTFNFSENRKNDISFIQVILMWKGAKGDVYFRRPKLEMASLPSAYTEDTVASVEPNHNLLQDSRDLLNGWQKYGSNVSLDATGDMAWYQGMRVQHLFGDWSYYGTTNKPTLENGKYYTVSAYMRGLREADINMYATILSNKSNNASIDFPLERHLTGDWRRYSYTFKFDASTQVVNAGAIHIAGQGDWDSHGGSAYVAGIKLEEGKTATDWSPAPEDLVTDAEFTELAVKVDGVTATVASKAEEVEDARKPKGKPAFKTLGERLNYELTLDDALLIGKPISTEHKVMADNIIAKLSHEAFNFVFITDQHYASQSEFTNIAFNYGLNHSNNALYLDGKVDAIIAGGDNIDGHNNSYDALLNDQKQFALGFLGNTNNFSDKFILKGNHDDGSWRVYAFRNGTLTFPKVKTMPRTIDNDIFKKDYRNAELLFGEVRNGDSNYFYKDYPEKKVRLIGVDSNDTPMILAEDGGPKYPGINYMGYQQEQLNWLANTALQGVPEDYTTIIVSHEAAEVWPYDNELSNPKYGHHTNQAEFNRIIRDFINGGSGLITNDVQDNEIAVQTDFTNQGKRILAGYIHGHHHKEMYKTSTGFNDIGVINSFGPSWDVDNDVDNDGWNVVSLDVANRKLIFKGFGTATDREFTY